MLQLRCTAKVRTYFGLKDRDLAEPVANASPLGAWYVNLITLGRRKAFIYMSDRTLLSFIIFGVRKDNAEKVAEKLRFGLGQLLFQSGLEIGVIEAALAATEGCEFTKTDSAKLLGNLNDLTSLYQHCIADGGGLEFCNLGEIIALANRTPQRNLGWGHSIDVAKELLEGHARRLTA